MPVKSFFMRVGLFSFVAAFIIPPASFASSVWRLEKSFSVSGMCQEKPLAPYVGALKLKSKYDQTDDSKSTLVEKDKNTKYIESYLKNYIHELTKKSKRFQQGLESGNLGKASKAIVCFDAWVESWAAENAMLNPDANSTGKAARKWFLAALSSTILRTQALSNGRYTLSVTQEKWLTNLGNLVIEEYTPRRTQSSVYFNNHDYWAGWAIAATAMVLKNKNPEKKEFLIWSGETLRLALQQINVSEYGDYAYLPFEVHRGALGADYSNYAMIPLILMVDTAKTFNQDLSEEDLHKLGQLATFTARAVLEPEKLPEFNGIRQQTVGAHKMVWVLPFLSLYPQHEWANRLYEKHKEKISAYGQIGGEIKLFYQ